VDKAVRTFLNEIKPARKAAQLTLEQLGELVGVGKSQIHYYEKLESEPSLGIALKISKELMIDFDWSLV